MRTESIFALTAAASLALSAGALHADTALTIYSSAQPGGIPAEWYRPVPGQNNWVNHSNIPGYAVVKEDRAIAFDRGEGELSFTGVAALLDPTTVSFVSLDDPATKVLEQDYRFDLVSNEKLIQRFIDRPVTVMTTQGAGRMAHSGTLLSASGGLVLQKDTGGIVTIRDYDTIDFPSLPGGLLTKPTLVWKTWSPEGGEQDTRLSYQTTGITWWADYNLVFTPGADANSGTVDVGAWVSILNKSGGAYEDAKLKLVAGEVNRAPVFQPARGRGGGVLMERGMMADAAPKGFEEKSFFEYHLYTLGRPATIPENSTKQLELFEGSPRVPAEKVFVYDGSRDASAVGVYLEFENDEDDGLGIPFPAGRVRVSQLDAADDSLEFVGEDTIEHTPREEKISVKLGNAFDIVGERRITDTKRNNDRKFLIQTVEVTLRNRKTEPVDVVVLERLIGYTGWRVVEETDEHRKKDAQSIEYPVTLEPDEEKVITYTVRYTW
jgi:hypothetical protein